MSTTGLNWPDRTNGKKPLFKGEVIIGPNKITYSVPAQASGTYEFHCEPHDFTMIGTFIIGDGKAAAPRSRLESHAGQGRQALRPLSGSQRLQ